MSLTDELARAIATFEGYFQPGTLAARNNNPGNLRRWGNLPVKDGYAVFPTPEAGWDALRHQVEKNIGRGLSLREFFGGKPGVYGGYAPSSDANNPEHYAEFVAGRVGVPVDVPLLGAPFGTGAPGSADLGAMLALGAVALALAFLLLS